MIDLEEKVIITSALHHNLARKKSQENSKNPKLFDFGKYGRSKTWIEQPIKVTLYLLKRDSMMWSSLKMK